jgi:predicted flap endonuclease-1-like 5' DNA nuclease
MIKWLKRWLPIIVLLALVVWWLRRLKEDRSVEGEERILIDAGDDVQSPIAIPLPADDLTVIEGIGPKLAALLEDSGIRTYGELAATDVVQLRQILRGARLPFVDPETWPEQAVLAAEGRWDALETLQDGLRGGRRV